MAPGVEVREEGLAAGIAALISPTKQQRLQFPPDKCPRARIPWLLARLHTWRSRATLHGSDLTLAYNIYLICSCSQSAIKSKSTQLPGKEKGSCSSPPLEPK